MLFVNFNLSSENERLSLSNPTVSKNFIKAESSSTFSRGVLYP